MRRRRTKGEDVGVSLFPFLAVLLCTMGTLIVLLLVITERAQHTTDEPPSAESPAVAAQASAEDDPATWRKRQDQLAAAREEVAAVVKDRRARLGLLERSTRELENKIAELKAQLAEAQRLSQADADQVAKTEAEVKRLEDRAAEAAASLEDIRRENTNRPASFSIVPYDGPNSTPRRPVYIECRGKEVILQPEGIILSEDDFFLASDAGNPLATVLRATREYLVTSQSLGEQQEPYPLIIVRPDAVDAYYNVRQSLQGWTTDFGYELVNQDWTLKFPPPDPNLATTQYRALAEARLRQAALANMLQRRSKKNPSYMPGSRAGILREGDDHGFGTAGIPYHGEEVGEHGGDGTGDATAGDVANAGGGRGTAGQDQSNHRATSAGQGTGANGRGRAVAGNAGLGGRGGAAHSARPDGTADGTGGEFAAGDASGRGPNGTATGANGDRADGGPLVPAPASTTSSPRAGEYGAREPNRENRGTGGAPAASGAGNANGGDAANFAGGTAGGSAAGGPSGGAAGDSGSSFSTGAADPSTRMESAKLASESLANRRGRDWGLRYAAPTATPVTRPLRVVCYSDRIILLTDDPKRAPKQIVLKPETRESADEFVAAVWDEIKAWGIAGKGMYWKPVLSFDVHAGGDRRYEDLAKLLDGSGFDVRRRPTTVARQGPVGTPMRPNR